MTPNEQVTTQREERLKRILAHDNATLSLSNTWYCVACLAGFIAQIFVLGIHFSFGFVFVKLLDDFDVSKAKAAFVGSVAISGCYLFVPTSRTLCRQYGFRAVTISGGALMAFGLFLTASVPSIVEMYLTYSIIFGFGSSMVFYASSEVVSKCFIRYRFLATVVTLLSNGAAFICMAPLLRFLLTECGFAITFRVLSGVSLVLCLCGAAFHPRIKRDNARKRTMAGRLQSLKEDKTLDITLCKSPAFVAFVGAVSLGILFYYVPHVHMVRYCHELHFASHDTVFLYFYLGLASIIGRVVFTKLNAIQCMKPLYLFQLSLLGVGIAMVTIPVADTWIKMMICYMAIGFFDSGVFTPLSSVVAECVEVNKVKQGWVFLHFIMGLSSAFGPPVAGFIAARQDSYRPAFLVAGGTVITGACALTVAKCLLCVYEITEEEQRDRALELQRKEIKEKTKHEEQN